MIGILVVVEKRFFRGVWWCSGGRRIIYAYSGRSPWSCHWLHGIVIVSERTASLSIRVAFFCILFSMFRYRLGSEYPHERGIVLSWHRRATNTVAVSSAVSLCRRVCWQRNMAGWAEAGRAITKASAQVPSTEGPQALTDVYAGPRRNRTITISESVRNGQRSGYRRKLKAVSICHQRAEFRIIFCEIHYC